MVPDDNRGGGLRLWWGLFDSLTAFSLEFASRQFPKPSVTAGSLWNQPLRFHLDKHSEIIAGLKIVSALGG